MWQWFGMLVILLLEMVMVFEIAPGLYHSVLLPIVELNFLYQNNL